MLVLLHTSEAAVWMFSTKKSRGQQLKKRDSGTDEFYEIFKNTLLVQQLPL